MIGRAVRLLRIGFNVADLARAKAFYQEALGFAFGGERNAGPAERALFGAEKTGVRIARLRLGEQELELAACDPVGPDYPPHSTAADLWFQHCAIVTTDMQSAYEKVRRQGATPITRDGPQRLPAASGGGVAYKFRDPDGHPLELIQFPANADNPTWPGTSTATTLGIDHSALSVSDASGSLAFYGSLGLGVGSRQINTGPAQDRLDGLSGVVVDVIGLSSATITTPHVELLSYHTPRGRRGETSGKAGGIADGRLVFDVEHLDGLVERVTRAGGTATPVQELVPGRRAALARDPDGHAVILLEEGVDA
jgi:catechol 2,3-dioxygenase-like lactoylglutathione lyase family enzyme